MNPINSAAKNPVSSNIILQKKGSLYNRIGGEEGLRKLVETFYDIIEFEPQGRGLHILHLRGHGVAHSRIEQFNFLSGFLGGPQLYIEKYKHSNVREMHAHVEIDATTRDLWLVCMSVAIDRVGLPTDVKDDLMTNFTRVAFQLKNKD
ncbi:group II truncated hemoglobin [Methylobacillus sp. Pita1]|uniref:group II truncated hemoglobin n=1 Tax=Methylobacillus sp. Pita1 TaxID=3382642 RepID=UPI0038B5A48A